MKVLVLGAGKMIGAIVRGLVGKEDLSDWQFYSPSGISAQKLAKEVGAKWAENLSSPFDVDYIFLACKPQQLKDLAHHLPSSLKHITFVSLLAAISEKEQRNILGVKSLIRVMPNMATETKEGVSLISSESTTDMRIFLELFNKIGKAIQVKESELDELTLLTGSGGALIYEFALILSQSFISLDQKTRENLARQVLIGAGEVLKTSPNKDVTTLISEVTSKGGVTIAALDSLRSSQFSQTVANAILDGKKRSLELKEIIRQS